MCFIVLVIVRELSDLKILDSFKMVNWVGVRDHVMWQFKKLRVQVHVSPTSTKVVVPLVVGHFSNQQEQQVNNSTLLITEIIVNEPTVDEPRQIALRKFVITDDYVVHLEESYFDLGIGKDPITFLQVKESINFSKWVDT